jgi:F-type H+-transporting ATPase subunit epsilon
MTLHVELVSPERVVLDAEATMVTARTLGGGDIAFMTGHAPFLGALDTYTLTIFMADGSHDVAAVHGGFISVTNDHVRILSDMAELGSDIDVNRAERARQAAEEAARVGSDAEAEAALRRAQARLSAAGVSAS